MENSVGMDLTLRSSPIALAPLRSVRSTSNMMAGSVEQGPSPRSSQTTAPLAAVLLHQLREQLLPSYPAAPVGGSPHPPISSMSEVHSPRNRVEVAANLTTSMINPQRCLCSPSTSGEWCIASVPAGPGMELESSIEDRPSLSSSPILRAPKLGGWISPTRPSDCFSMSSLDSSIRSTVSSSLPCRPRNYSVAHNTNHSNPVSTTPRLHRGSGSTSTTAPRNEGHHTSSCCAHPATNTATRRRGKVAQHEEKDFLAEVSALAYDCSREDLHAGVDDGKVMDYGEHIEESKTHLYMPAALHRTLRLQTASSSEYVSPRRRSEPRPSALSESLPLIHPIGGRAPAIFMLSSRGTSSWQVDESEDAKMDDNPRTSRF